MSVELAEECQQESGSALTPIADAVSTALAEVVETNNTITAHLTVAREIAARNANVVADVRTVKGYEQIAAIRTELREQGRYPIQRHKETGSKLLGTMQRQFNARCEEIIAEIKTMESPFQEQLDAEDARKEAEKRLRDEAEQRRKDGHLEAIAAINRIASNAVGLDSASIDLLLTGAQDIIVDEGYEEFQGQAQQAKDEAVRQLQGLLIAARADEEDRREAEEARQRQAAFAQAQAEAARAAEAQAAQERAAREAAEAESAALRQQLADMQAAQERQREEQERAARERADAIQTRIQWFGEVVAKWRDGSSKEIAAAIQAVQSHIISADLFGERINEADAAKADALLELDGSHAGALAREAEEAAAAMRTRRNELLSTLVGMGENALLAVQDGSADVAQLVANRAVIADTDLTKEVWGDLVQSAVGARSEALRKTDLAIEQTKERDRLAAEEAERQRQQDAEAAAARALADAKRGHAEAMYALLRQMVIELAEEGRVAHHAKALLRQINPNEDFED